MGLLTGNGVHRSGRFSVALVALAAHMWRITVSNVGVTRSILTIALAVGLTSCGNEIVRNYSLDQKKNAGVLFLTYTSIYSYNMLYGNLNVTNGSLFLKKIGEEKPIRTGCGDTAPRWGVSGFPPGQEFGCIAAIELPAGEYTLTGVEVPGGGGYSSNTDPYDFRFAIHPGKVTYFGNLQITSPNLTESHRTKKVSLLVKRSNRNAKDVPLFLSSYTHVDASSIVVDSNCPRSPSLSRPLHPLRTFTNVSCGEE